MESSRRSALKAICAAPGLLRGAQAEPFEATWESLQRYRCPEWFRNAKFGIWSHWGPQGAPRQGDWYARNMYIQGTRQYKYHVEHYGHPSKVGYKDIIPLWTAKNWEPETLMRRYKRAGARYFVSLGVHCDNFDCWASKHHRWNAVNFGPKRDVVGTWRKVARDHGLRFGVSEHLAWSFSWFNVNKGTDKEGPLAGVPYDGNDPKNQDLYFPPHDENTANYSLRPPDYWKQGWFNRIRDLIDQSEPDFVYTDGGAFGDVGLKLMAHYYNRNSDGVYTLKNHKDQVKFGQYRPGAAVLDVERGVVDGISAEPFNTDTCIGQWQYFDGFPYKTSRQIIEMLVDVVSRNGSLLLSVPQLPDGTIDTHCEGVIDDLTRWFAVNAEAIYDTRPWKVCGEGPTVRQHTGEMKSEKGLKAFTSEDIRFTQKAGIVYAFITPTPGAAIHIRSLATPAPQRVSSVRLLGSSEKLTWTRTAEALIVQQPKSTPVLCAAVLKIEG
jgi:alpha-L-fucosidase